MPISLIIASAIILIIIFIAVLVLLNSLKSKGHLERALNLSLFLVRLPRGSSVTKEGQQKQPKEEIAAMEQLISAFANIHAKGWNKFVYGEPYVGLELGVHHVGEEIHFYLATPKTHEEIFVKQIQALFPAAEVERTMDYNIFNPNGAVSGAYLTYTQDPILPVNTYQKLGSDPVEGILTSLSKLNIEGEGASIQILLRPSHSKLKSLAAKVSREMNTGYPFREAYQRAKNPSKPKPQEPGKIPEPEKPKTVTPAEEEVIKSITGKFSKPLFDVNIRLLASAPTQIAADQLLQELEGSLAQFSAPDLNSFKAVRLTNRSLEKLIYNYSFRIFDAKQLMLMSTEEVSSFYHFPITSTAATKVEFLKAKLAEPPTGLPQEGIIIGENTYRGQKTTVHMTDADRQRHMYVVGQTGTGKTTLLKAMMRQDIERGKGVCVIDPHGEFADFILSVVPKERAEDVIYFSPGDVERPLGLNMLEIDPTKPEQKTFIANELLQVIKSVYKDLPEAFGPMFEQYFKNAVLLLLDDYEHEIPTIAEIPRILADENYRRDKLSREANPLVKNFWEMEAEKAGGEASLANMVPYITSKLNPFLANDYVRPIIGQRKSAFSFRDVMDNQKILIVNLSKGKIGDANANLLGMLVVGKLLMAAFSRVDIVDEKQRKDFYLYIDEFQNFTTESIASILSEARKYRLDLIIAHQFIKQLIDKIRDAVFGNVGSMAVFRISADDAETDIMKNSFAPVFTPQDLTNIENLNAYIKLLINGTPARPFNIRIPTELVFGAGAPEMIQTIKEISKLKYGQPREEVEAEIRARYQSK